MRLARVAGWATLVCMTTVPAAAAARWHAASTPHFVIYADDTAEHVRQFATRIERFDQAIRRFTKAPAPPVAAVNRLSIFLLPDEAAVTKLGDGGEYEGMYLPRAEDPVAFVVRPAGRDWLSDDASHSTLFHEYTHHFMLTRWSEGAFPAWFVEGFAEMLGSARIDGGTVVLGGVPTGAGWDLNRAKRIPVATLLTSDASAAEKVEGFYGQSWLLTHYLMMGKGHEALGRYIRAINAGKSLAVASAELGDLGQLDRDLRAYAERPSLPAISIPVEGLPPGEITVRALGDGEAAMMPVRMRSKTGPGPRNAAKNVALARRLAAPFPTDPEAQLALAEAELDAGNAAEADAAADRVLAVDPKRVRALVWKGTAQMLLAARDPGADAARWKAVRRWFLRAIELDRADPAPLIAYNRSVWEAREEQGEDAQDTLLLAQALGPQDVRLRMRTGRMLVAAGRAAEALPMLRVVASDPHSGPLRDTARLIVADLERGDVAAAQATVKETAPRRQ